VTSRKAGDAEAWRWISDGKGAFTVAETEKEGRGTRITLHLRDGEDEYLQGYRLSSVIKTYSDHIAVPVKLVEDGKDTTVNSASALWTRPKSEITADQYKEFYHHAAHAFDEPWATIHYKAEGAIEYTALLFLPSAKPFDLFNPERKQHVKLYVKRIFITDDCSELLPPYLRFVKGIVDNQDLPLNVSREMLQHNPVLAKIRTGLVKRILGELKTRTEQDAEGYATFWENFGAVLKEGLYEDFERKQDILELCRFVTTEAEKPVSLADYVGRMKEGQEAIYFLTGEDAQALKKSPLLEGFRAKGIEVLLLTDAIDEFWIGAVGTYQDKPFRSVAQAGADLSKVAAPEKSEAEKKEEAPQDQVATLIASLKLALGEQVKDVRVSDRLTESPVCLVAAEGDMSMNLERMLRQHKQATQLSTRILEINPAHALIRKLAAQAARDGAQAGLDDAALLLLDQARIVEGEPVPDPVAFARRLSAAMEKGLVG
jgi:molecular chaperone HtpG